MSAFSRLWKRAPIWRLCLLSTIGGLGLTAFFPTPFLKHYAPWLPGDEHPLTPAMSPSATQETHPEVPFNAPNLLNTITGHFSLAGHKFPLPQGEWHPVLNAQDLQSSPIAAVAFMRSDHGIITGIVIAHATQGPTVEFSPNSVLEACHDDRLYSKQYHQQANHIDCSSLGHINFQTSPIYDAFLAATIRRLHTAGFPIPPLLITASWEQAFSHMPHQWQFTDETVLIAPPLDAITRQMLVPPEAWDKEQLLHFPIAHRFVQKSEQWLSLWQDALNRSVSTDGLIPLETLPHEIFRDPSAPQ